MINKIINNLDVILIIVILIIQVIQNNIIIFIQKKIDTKFNKNISDHNAKNDAKIHVSKALYDKEQIALQNILENFSNIISTFVLIHAMAYIDNEKKQFTIEGYCKALETLSTNTIISVHKSIKDFVYIIDEDIEDKFDKIYDKCYNIHKEITNLINNRNILELIKYLHNKLDELENDYKDIKKSIRKYYNNIKII